MSNELDNADSIPEFTGEMIIYSDQDGDVKLDVRLVDETIWLSQKQMSELFQVGTPTINHHIQSIFEDDELDTDSTIRNYRIVQPEGYREVTRNLTFYNLDMIIAIGYRVKSGAGKNFRKWATGIIKEYAIKGFVMDDERLKNPPVKDSAVPDYFDEMLERIRDIRASERRMYLRVKEIFALAGDYNPKWKETTRFFSIIQNKLHFAVTNMTAAEIIKTRADYKSENMGLTSWAGDCVRKSDVSIAKNYLSKDEIDGLNRIVVMWLDYAEDQAKRRKQVFMEDWIIKLDDFLEFNDRDVLNNSGSISKKDADTFAKSEYDKFAKRRREYVEEQAEKNYLSELEEVVKNLPPLEEKKATD